MPRYWPHQAFKDVLACLALMTAITLAVLWPWLMRRELPGVELLAPADPTESYAAARPEWFMLWLFQFLKFFPGGWEVWGAVVIPMLVFFVLMLLPVIGRWRRGRAFTLGFLGALGLAIATLTLMAWTTDRHDAPLRAARRQAHDRAERVKILALAPGGIPLGGAATLLLDDPRTQGPLLFARHCASCHRFGGHDGTGSPVPDPQSAPDLKGFASRTWLTHFVNPQHIASSNCFGGTKFVDGKMVKFARRNLTDLSPEEQKQLGKILLAVSAEARLPAQLEADRAAAAAIAEGRELITSADFACRDCHSFGGLDPDATAPDLTGYGSREWLLEFLSNPAHERFYGKKNDRMPAFGADDLLDRQSLGLIIDWLRGKWYEPAP